MYNFPISIQERLDKIKTNNHAVYYEDKESFCRKVYIQANSYESLWNNGSRYQALRVWTTEPHLIDKELLGKDKYQAILDLVDSAKETM